jgi:hypothetical protein
MVRLRRVTFATVGVLPSNPPHGRCRCFAQCMAEQTAEQ